MHFCKEGKLFYATYAYEMNSVKIAEQLTSAFLFFCIIIRMHKIMCKKEKAKQFAQYLCMRKLKWNNTVHMH